MARFAVPCMVAGLLATASGMAPARADDAKVRCAAAYEQAQELRRHDQLAESRRELGICEQTCPAILVRDCKRWRSEVEALMPTVRLSATDGGGHAVDARVFLDGAPLVDHVGAEAIPVDSGDHTFRFVTPSGDATEVKLSLHAGERDRAVDAVILPPAPAPASEAPSPAPAETPAASPGGIPMVGYVLGGLGVVGLGVGGALSLVGHFDASHLSSTCAPRCSPSDVDAIQTKYTVAWVSGGVGLAALAAAIVIWHPWQKPGSATMSGMFVAPTAGGAVLGLDF